MVTGERRRRSVCARIVCESSKGGFGLYYHTPLEELGAVAAAGTPLGEEGKPTPIEVLLKSERAFALAKSFHDAIKDTEYYERYERTDAPIPRGVLEELAECACLCRLVERDDEREAIRTLIFESPSEEAQEACEARRRAFGLFLSLLDGNGEVADHDGEFWRAVIRRFLADPRADGVEGRTVAAWSALAMKECVQDALCSVWTHFCRAGIDRQDLDGLSSDELAVLIRDLTGRTE